MNLLSYLAVVTAVWLILAAAGSAGWCAILALYRCRRPTTVRATYPPPVPAPLPRPEPDASWLAPWPSGAHLIDFDAVHELLSEPRKLEQQQVDRMFHEILACEGLS